jgi:hypothetical protein
MVDDAPSASKGEESSRPGMIRIDPRDFIHPPYRSCPACGKLEFGALSISNRNVSRRCRACWHTESSHLPALHKKLVYLDQMAYSGMAKTLDPVWREKQRQPQDEFWARMFDALDRVFKLQIIVCPTSRIHEKESVVAEQYFAVLRRLYEHLSGGVEFDFPSRVHEVQLVHALRAVLKGEKVDYSTIPRERVLQGNPDEWTERISIRAHWPAMDLDPGLMRTERENSKGAMEEIFARWAKEKKTFAELYAFERRGLADAMLQLFHEESAAEAAAMKAGEFRDPLNQRLEVGTMLTLLRIVREATGLDRAAVFQRVVTFLYSEEAMDAPFNDVGALLMAALARRAASGQKRLPSRGMWRDITAISTALPYCDAIFVDDECASLLGDEPLRSQIATYGTRVFSTATREEFLAYLTELEREAGPEHARAVTDVYGEEWLVPFRTLLEHERARHARTPALDATSSE